MTGAGLLAAEIGDPEATRTVIAIVALLCVMGVALVMLAFWLRRVTRPDPELLAPLELMGERSWRRGDPVGQRRRLDEVRPQGAEPLTRAAAPPKFDEAFDAGPSAPGFDDLRSHALTGTDGARDGSLPPAAAERDDAVAAASIGAEADEQAGALAADDGSLPEADAAGLPGAGGASDDTAAEAPSEATRPESEPDAPEVADDAAEPESVDDPDLRLDAVTDDIDDEPDSRTPMSTVRPTIDEFLADLSGGNIDPETLERARAELDAELRQRAADS